MKFSGLNVLSDAQKRSKLDDAERHYFAKGHRLSASDYCDIAPEKHLRFDYDTKLIVKKIKGLKKINSFYKRYADELAPAIGGILFIMDRIRRYPSPCKI